MAKKRAGKKSSVSKTVQKNPHKKTRWQAVPLKGSFMITAMLGFLISVYWVYPKSQNYAIAFMIVFAAMFAAAVVSMTKAPVVEV